MPPKKKTPTPAPMSSNISSNSPINPIVSTPTSGTSNPTPTLRTVPSTLASTVLPATITDSSSPDGLQDPSSSAPPKKRVRGPNRSKGTTRLIIQRENKKLDVAYKAGELHPYGKNASRFASEIGIIIRDYAPLKVKGWKNVDDKDKEVIYTRIKDKFNLNLNDEDMKNIVYHHCSNRYKNHRNKMHQHYTDMAEKGQNPRANPHPKVRSIEDWEWLCDNIFGNSQWQKRSKEAAKNKKKMLHTHRAGSKSFIGHRTNESSDDSVMELGRIELFEKTHFNAKHGWINEEAETRYKQMVELKEQKQGNNEVVDENAICAEILGSERNGYIPGLGPISRKGHSTKSSSQVEAQIQQRVADMAEQMRIDFQRERDETTTILRDQLRSELLVEMRREMEIIMNRPDEHPLSCFQSSQQPSPPPPPAPIV